MVFKLKPRDDKFFDYFEELADAIYEASVILKKFFEKQSNPSSNLDLINEVEERGDQILSTVMSQINSSFVTPFDREDILSLARELNNVVDHIQGTMEKVVLYKASRPGQIYVSKLVNVLEEAAIEIKNAVDKLPYVRTMSSEIIESCERIRSLEHEGDYLYRAGIALLFENTQNVV
ncbi:MAG: DUF47 family protein, partial [Syntrophomonadaceae bacterium]|nr:DUF47 family protein [Syntrophomonadaceae bacterium]